ncbi:hypothetical protein DRP04_09745, partial [Archaeoglobales archaeon]
GGGKIASYLTEKIKFKYILLIVLLIIVYYKLSRYTLKDITYMLPAHLIYIMLIINSFIFSYISYKAPQILVKSWEKRKCYGAAIMTFIFFYVIFFSRTHFPFPYFLLDVLFSIVFVFAYKLFWNYISGDSVRYTTILYITASGVYFLSFFKSLTIFLMYISNYFEIALIAIRGIIVLLLFSGFLITAAEKPIAKEVFYGFIVSAFALFTLIVFNATLLLVYPHIIPFAVCYVGAIVGEVVDRKICKYKEARRIYQEEKLKIIKELEELLK